MFLVSPRASNSAPTVHESGFSSNGERPGAAIIDAEGEVLIPLVPAAEDVELNRLILEDLLEHEGACVVFAENGRQALERLAEHGAQSFDVVLMDVQMP